MPKAVWKDVVLAQSKKCEVVEGNTYFPPSSLNRQYFQDSSNSTICGWGVASYFHVVVGESVNKNAAWYYATPSPAVRNITGYVAFGKEVQVE